MLRQSCREKDSPCKALYLELTLDDCLGDDVIAGLEMTVTEIVLPDLLRGPASNIHIGS